MNLTPPQLSVILLPMIAKLVNWWRPNSRWERAGWGLVALCLLGAATVGPLVRGLAPEYVVGAASAGGSFSVSYGAQGMTGFGQSQYPDPWGQPVRLIETWQTSAGKPTSMDKAGRGARTVRRFYSVGPDGIDERGQGDDVVPTPLQQAVGHWSRLSPISLAALAALLVLLLRTPWSRRPRASLHVEAGRVLVLGSCTAVCSYLVLFSFLSALASYLGLQATGKLPWMVLKLEEAATASVLVLSFLLAFVWRLRARPEATHPTELDGAESLGAEPAERPAAIS